MAVRQVGNQTRGVLAVNLATTGWPWFAGQFVPEPLPVVARPVTEEDWNATFRSIELRRELIAELKTQIRDARDASKAHDARNGLIAAVLAVMAGSLASYVFGFWAVCVIILLLLAVICILWAAKPRWAGCRSVVHALQEAVSDIANPSWARFEHLGLVIQKIDEINQWKAQLSTAAVMISFGALSLTCGYFLVNFIVKA